MADSFNVLFPVEPSGEEDIQSLQMLAKWRPDEIFQTRIALLLEPLEPAFDEVLRKQVVATAERAVLAQMQLAELPCNIKDIAKTHALHGIRSFCALVVDTLEKYVAEDAETGEDCFDSGWGYVYNDEFESYMETFLQNNMELWDECEFIAYTNVLRESMPDLGDSDRTVLLNFVKGMVHTAVKVIPRFVDHYMECSSLSENTAPMDADDRADDFSE